MIKFKNNLLILIALSSIFLLSSCAKEVEESSQEIFEVSVEATISDFGGVILGSDKSTSIKVTNNSQEILDINLTIPQPFLLSSVSQACLGRKLAIGQSCIVSIKFEPIVEGEFFLDLTFGDKILNFKGVGLKNGFLIVDSSVWDIGTSVAGTTKTKNITITNLGDLSITSPEFIMPSYIQVGLNRCGAFIASKQSCKVNLEARLTEAGTNSGQITIQSIDGGFVNIDYVSTVEPSSASGLISFENTPFKMDSEGEEFLFKTKEIKDSFGNKVSEGTRIFLTVNSNLLSLDGNSFDTDSEGKISFRIRTRTIKGEAIISLVSEQASGYLSFPITAGDAFGTISIKSFINNIPANGQTQTIITTEVIYDQYNNIIEDGTEVIFEVVGDASVSAGNNPKIKKTISIGGTAFVRVTAGTTASDIQLKVYSGEILNEFNEIVGYKANGTSVVSLVSGPAYGQFNMVSGVNSIYSNNNPPEGIDIPTQTGVNLGPIVDEFGNIVAENSPIQISISNGFNVSGVVPENNSVIYTDSFGRSSFLLVGANQRGNIKIDATIAGASSSLDVWSYEKSRVKYETSQNQVDFNFLHSSAQYNPNVDRKWGIIKDGVPMANLDSNYYGFLKYSDRPATKFSLSDNFPYFNWNCGFTAGSFLIFNFCIQPDGTYSPLYKYGSNFDFTLDSPQVNNLEELVLNGDFSPQKELDFWDDFEGTSQTSTGVKYSSDYTGSLWIDNQLFVDPEDNSSNKNFAVSSPITVSSDKRYIIVFTIKSMIGITDNSFLEIGYVKENASSIGQSGYSLPNPTIIRNNYSTDDVNVQQRLVFLPPSNTDTIRLYFSTKGSGSMASIKIDDISMKELTTQNIHDTFSTDGVSIGYMRNWDQAVMFGGTTVIEQSSSQYTSQNSSQTTVLSRILDTSIGVVVSEYDSQSQTDIGDRPSPRGYMSMESSDDNLYSYGGLSLSGDGIAKDDFYIWSGSSLKWSKTTVLPDPSIFDPDELGLGKPGKRYQNGLLFIPEVNNLYLVGGLQQDKDDDSKWSSKDDLWKMDLSQEDKVWNRICDLCNFVPNGIYSNLGTSWKDLVNNPNTQTLSNYVFSARNVKNINSFWHTATQSAYFYIPETNFFKKFNPYDETLSDLPIAGISDFKTMYQLEYNSELGRTFGYARGEPGQEDSRIFFWDMNRDEKQYIKVTFNLESETKNFIKELKINLYAYGQSQTYRPEGTIIESGVELYLFNYQSIEWELVGENIANDAQTAQTPIEFLVSDYNSANYVSIDGKVSALITPKGRPGFAGGDPKMGEDLELVKLQDVSGSVAEFEKLYTGGQTSCGILKDNSVKCWGRNDTGQLGQGVAVSSIGESSNEMASIQPINIFDSSNPDYFGVTVSQLAIGGNHVCSLLSNKEVKCWGDNSYGKLGLGLDAIDSNASFGDGINEMGSFLPKVQLFDESLGYEVVKLVAGLEHTCALIKVSEFGTRNRVKCWGRNQYGQLGNNQSVNFGSSPASMGDNLPWVEGIISFNDVGLGTTREGSIHDISSGNYHTCSIVETGQGLDALQCWGRNNNGQLSLINDLTDKKIATSTSIQTIEIYKLKSGGDHNCMTFFDGSFDKFFCWGKNDYGQLGRGGGGIVSTQLVKNSDFSSGINNWDTIGTISPSIINEEASVRGGGNGLRQEFNFIKNDKTYNFSMDLRQNIASASSNLLDSSLVWEQLSGSGSGNGVSIEIGSDPAVNQVSRRRTFPIEQLEPSRTYTYKFKVENAQGQPYFKILDENFNIIYSSDKLSEGFTTVSFQLLGFQDIVYIDWYVDKYLSATIEQMELFKNPLSSVPITVNFFKNNGFGYESFDSVTMNDTGTLRHEFIAPSSNIKFEIVSSIISSTSEEVFLDNIEMELKDEILVQLPLDLNFEFISVDEITPNVSNLLLLEEAYVPKNELPNFRALHQKMLSFESSAQNRIQLEDLPNTNIGTEDFVIDMEIDPKGLGIKRPLISKIGLSELAGIVNITGGWIAYIDPSKRLVFYSEEFGIVAESQIIDTGFQKIRIQRTTEEGINKIKFYRDIGLGWKDITVNTNLSSGNSIQDLTGLNLSNNTDAPIVIGSTFDDSSLEGPQRASGHFEGLIGYIYLKIGSDTIEFIDGLLTDNNVLADFTDIGGAEIPIDFDLGDEHTCVVSQSNDVKCFGQNTGGQLGYGQGVDEYGISLEQMGFNLNPVDLGTNGFVKSISAGREFNCVILNDDTSKCWGRNSFGQLGIDSTEGRGRGKDNVTGTNELKIDYIDLEGIF